MSRRERQQQHIASALERGHYARVLVLAREHLAEYPDDEAVRDAAESARAVWPPPRETRREI
jgi:hypothetical protein